MNYFRTALNVLLLACAVEAPRAQPMEKWGYPDPDAFAKATHTLCEEQNLSVMLAATYRDQGKPKEQVLALLPDNPLTLQLRAIDVYRENIEDVYAYPNIAVYPLTVFRAEVCRREVQSARTLGRFATVQERVLSCQAQHGPGKSNELYVCIRKVVLSM